MPLIEYETTPGTPIEPEPQQATGRIMVTQTDQGRTYRWEGNDLALFTRSLLETADRGMFTWVRFPEQPGDRFTCGPYSLEVVEWQRGGLELLLARRMFW